MEGSRIYEFGTMNDFVVCYVDDVRTSIEAARGAGVPTPSGAGVRLSALATISADRGPNDTLRENVERRVVVTANTADQDLRVVYEDVSTQVRERVDMPAGGRVTHAGQDEREDAPSTKFLFVLVNLPLARAGGSAPSWGGDSQAPRSHSRER